ncbi:Sushi, von Willebrand factor type A, EGF and pentraxin domain-containing protein 1 [Stylophora pistillata]|uniref:Sushi, von Willebrand factor type A, EGF and pentraxin domain-containing protein 1 n=1 Tax=Stylophora pistillata TaxID=50429 RepID=A0A2B4RGS4_STYPI|nr:Sushi, von Willebrand factor type A, EGF and pentraxin domain-containing protein 1 [Stylophora pistillata]
MKDCLILLYLAVFFCSSSVDGGLLDDKAKILTDFKAKYNNSQSDIIFLMDVSGSVSNYGFQSEKIFVDNLLNEFSVAPYSTRVAVITFGADVKTDINYIDISPLSKTHQKCEFQPWFQYNVKHRYGRATNMRDAFQTGINILQSAMDNQRRRSGVHTVAIMITDGWWNRGSPVENANRLKSSYATDIITVGVDGYNAGQLQQLASSNDLVLGFHTFTQFRELAMFIRGDAHDKTFMEVDASECTSGGCDSKAFCACGTVSAVYQCVCRQGYRGDGLLNGEGCILCGRGTYKQWATPSECIACPEHSSTDAEGSILKSQCKCKTGYEGDPSRDIACTAVKCEQLLAPQNGGFLAACDIVYDSVCEFQCSSGYNLVGSSSRRCQSNKQWSGTAVECQVITCAVLPPLNYGDKSCSGRGYEYGNICTFTCDVGYERRGSATRICQADAQWSGSATSCEARKCPALRRLAFGDVEPEDCVTTPQPYQRGCTMQCVSGYTLNGDSRLECGSDGNWVGTFPTCEDRQPPYITCPPDVNNGTDPERATRSVTWSDPVVSDNAELHDPNAAPTVTRSPEIVSPYDFPIGTTRITYTATDKGGLIQACVFTVTVSDNEPPAIYCPQNMEVQKKSDTPTIKVYWPPPTYRDNSGGAITVFTESINGSDFRTGSYPIKYTATDESNNKGSCTFIIVISSVKCKPYDPPINGLISCAHSDAIGGEGCTPQCSSKKEFARVPATFYVCQTSGNWYVWDFRPTVSLEMPWPDCTEEYVPGAARKGMEWQYFVGDCSDPAVQQQAKENFIRGFNEVFSPKDPNYCQREKICALENIKITCGEVQRRRRRNAQAVLTIELNVEVITQNDDFDKAKSDLEGNVTNARNADSMKTIQANSQTMTLKTVKETPTTGVCVDGAVFGLNQGQDYLNNIDHSQRCQNCPSGTYYDVNYKNCSDCPLNTYNTYTAAVGQCTVCPEKTYTLAVGSKNITQCLAACQPGEFSPTGLANCAQCPLNTYQSLLRQTSCIACPGSSVTLGFGTNSISGCGMPCAPGTYSQTGVEPCLPCAKGTYQPNKKQTKCLSCDINKSTYGEGASSLSQCIAIVNCASSPCNNDATCVEVAQGYKCNCKPGFAGANCEIEEDECLSSPCAKGSTCVDKINAYECLCPPEYTGVHCDVKTSSCDSSKCAAGAQCVNSPEGHECVCPDGYEGQFCETKINECKAAPCKNGGICLSKTSAFQCICPTGFSGNLCEKNENGCLPDSCLNGGTCKETSYGPECTCLAGFAGTKCKININECSSSPCLNNGHCVDQTNGYKCYCKPSFKGSNCETEISTDFDMEFDRTQGRGLAILEMRQELRAFSVAFWMKVANSEVNPGTPLSYAVKVGEKIEDNALVIHDYNGFNIWVNGQKASTNVAANDDKWHHMTMTWESSTGTWKAYKDGSLVRQSDPAEPFQKGQVIAAGGSFVLGQEQDDLAANFSANEAFIGKMSQMNVWSYELTAGDIADLARHAESLLGNVVGWSDFFDVANSGIKKIKPSAARTENKCWTAWLNNDSPTSGAGDAETRAGACAGPGPFDCQDIEGRSMPDLELNLTSTCSDSGITCLNSDQRTGRSCPDFKVRYVCTCPANSACNSNPCGAHGTCETLPVGYKCKCQAGYEGRLCNTALKCPCPGKIAHGLYSGSRKLGGKITIHCGTGFKASGTATLNCVGGKWDALVPQCIDIDECSTGQANC